MSLKYFLEWARLDLWVLWLWVIVELGFNNYSMCNAMCNKYNKYYIYNYYYFL